MSLTNATNSTVQEADSDVTFGIVLVSMIEGVFAVICNALLLIVFFKNPYKDMRGTVSMLIFNVTLSDLFGACVFIIWNTSHWWKSLLPPKWLYNVLSVGFWMSVLTTALTLLVLSFERYIVVKRPWEESRLITKRRTVLACATTWIVSIVLCVTLVNNQEIFFLVLSALIEISVVIQVLFYVLLWRQRQSEKTTTCIQNEREQRQLTLVVFLLVFIVIVTVLPEVISYQMFAALSLMDKLPETVAQLNYVVFYLLPLFSANFFLNPMIYAWRLKKYRKSFIAVFRGEKQSRQTRLFDIEMT